MIQLPEFETRKHLTEWVCKNKFSLIAQKKAIFKKADSFSGTTILFDKKSGSTIKAVTEIAPDVKEIKVKAIINTTNVIDSHLDLHLPGIWSKSVKEYKYMMHVQEHEMQKFDKIISDGDDLKALIEKYTWKELGYDYKGETEALVFESIVKQDRNAYMFDQYAKGRVRNHSVGMQYIKMSLCVDDKDYEDEYNNYKKYIKEAVNPEVAESIGMFWAQHEAKAIEGSAVPLGSNQITPTISIEPGNHSNNKSGQQSINDTESIYQYLSKNIKLV